jgi:general secretion pathway protein L
LFGALMAIDRTAEFDSMRAALAALLRAWKDELSDFARERIPNLSRARGSHLEIEVDEDGFAVNLIDADGLQPLGRIPRGDAATASLGRILSQFEKETGRDVTLRISSSLALRPQIKLPSASKRMLKGALSFELERLTPIDPAALYFDFIVHSREPETNLAQVTLRVVRRAVLDEAVLVCHSAGALIGNIGFSGDAQEGDWASYPIDRPAFLRAQWRRFGNLALMGAASILFVAVIIAGYARGSSANDALSDQVADATTRAAIVERMEHRIETANTQISRLVTQRQGPLFIESLAALSRLLPDGTWLTELHLEGNKLRADGYSKNASALIGIVDRSGTFANAQFSSPLVRNPADGTDRFELTFDVAQPKGAK